MPEEDPQLKGNKASISIPIDDLWAVIKTLLQVTSAQVAAAEANHHKKLKAKREKIERKSIPDHKCVIQLLGD